MNTPQAAPRTGRRTIMKADPTEDPRVIIAGEELGKLLVAYMGAPVTEHLVQSIEDVIEEFRSMKRMQGVRMPRLRVVALPQSGYIQVWPADMEQKDFDIRIKLMIRALQENGKNYDPEELAKAIRRAYPEYSPSTSKLIT